MGRMPTFHVWIATPAAGFMVRPLRVRLAIMILHIMPDYPAIHVAIAIQPRHGIRPNTMALILSQWDMVEITTPVIPAILPNYLSTLVMVVMTRMKFAIRILNTEFRISMIACNVIQMDIRMTGWRLVAKST